MIFVSAPIYNRVTRAALNEGVDKSLIQSNNLPDATFSGKEYLPMDHLLRMYELGDDHIAGDFALIAGQELEIDDYNTLGLAWKTSWNVRDCLLRLARFLIVITNKGDYELVEKGARSYYMVNNRPVHRKGQSISNEVTFIVLLKIIREITGKPIAPIQIKFRHAEPKSIQDYQDYFQCKVLFNQTENSVCFDTRDLEIPSIKADKSIHNFIVERLEEEKEGIEKNPNLIAQGYSDAD